MPDVIDSATDTTKEVAPGHPPRRLVHRGISGRGRGTVSGLAAAAAAARMSSIEALRRCQSTSERNPWVTYCLSHARAR